MSRALLAGLVAALLLAAPASAQTFAPVVGAGSFTTAPILEPGAYRDTILPEEYLYYGVRLEAGQRLRVTANAETPAIDVADLSVTAVNVNLHAPDREGITSARATFRGSDEDPAEVATEPAQTVAEAGGSAAGAWAGPGVYFVSFFANYVGDGEPPKAEIPFTFTVAVEGQAQSEPSPSPTSTSTATPTASADATASPASVESDTGASPALAAGIGVGGLLVGVLAGLGLRSRQRRS